MFTFYRLDRVEVYDYSSLQRRQPISDEVLFDKKFDEINYPPILGPTHVLVNHNFS